MNGAPWPGKLVPVLAMQSFGGQAVFFKKLQRKRIYTSGWMAARAERSELIFPDSVKNCFRHDAACRIAGTQEQNIKYVTIHGKPLTGSRC